MNREIGYWITTQGKKYGMPKKSGCPKCGEVMAMYSDDCWSCGNCDKLFNMEEVAVEVKEVE